MVAEIISFIVIGKIPGTEIVLDYKASLIFVGVVIVLMVANMTLLATHRKKIKQLIRSTYEHSVSLITI